MNINSITRLPDSALEAYGKVLVTGGTGRVGKPLLERLAQLGFSIKAVAPDQPCEHPAIEWVPMDFTQDLDFTQALEGVTHILHLGAELWEPSRMEKVNSAATQALVVAAEAAGVKYFCYTSSICTYGSPKRRHVTEDTELMPSEGASREDYIECDMLIEYGRTKLLGENHIREHAAKASYVIFRPTEITWEKHILRARDWSMFTRMWRGGWHSHQVYYRDVINAIIYFLLRSSDPARTGQPGQVEVYNLSNDDAPNSRFGDFMKKAYAEVGDKRYRLPVMLPVWFNYVKDRFKWKTLNLRYPLSMVYVDPAKLYATGYRHEYGLAEAQRSAIEQLKHNGS